MIRDYFERKAADAIDRSRIGNTRSGKVAVALLDPERIDNEVYVHDLSNSEASPGYRRLLILFVAANAVSWLSVFLLPSFVSAVVIAFQLILPKASLVLLAPAVGFTMLFAFAVMRKWFPERPTDELADSPMSSYGDQENSLLTWKLWVVSSAIAAIDGIALLLAFNYMTGLIFGDVP